MVEKLWNENSIYGHQKCKNHFSNGMKTLALSLSLWIIQPIVIRLFVYFSATTQKFQAKGLTLPLHTIYTDGATNGRSCQKRRSNLSLTRKSIKQSNKQSARAFAFHIISLLFAHPPSFYMGNVKRFAKLISNSMFAL